MAIQILPPEPNFGGELGSALGQGLQALAQYKLNRKLQTEERERAKKEKEETRQSKAKALKPHFPDRTEEELLGMADLDDSIVKELYRQEQLKPQRAAVQNILGMQASPMQPATAPGGIPNVNVNPNIAALAAGQPQQMTQPSKLERLFAEAPQLAKEYAPIIQAQETEAGRERRHKEKIELEKEQFATKQAAPFLKEVRDENKSAESKIHDLNRLIQLADTGKLRTGPAQQLLSKVGFGSLGLSPESQEAQSISNQLVLDFAKDMKGSLSDKDIQFLRQMVPSLFNTEEGMKRLANAIKLKEEAKKERYKVSRELRKEHKMLPADFADLVEEKAESRIKKLADQALSELQKESKAKSETFSDINEARRAAKASGATAIKDKKTGRIIRI